MNSVLLEIPENRSFLSPLQQPNSIFQPPPPHLSSHGFNLNNRVSPTILLIIIILAVFFFISGLLHLLVRFLLRPNSNRNPNEMENLTVLQGQLQQLFSLHDSGVDQSYIDTLPVFKYKAIIGVKAPFDCAVCLCEFDAEDKLRLLPKCSHAFHMGCIETWLLSHSTCPLCRANLVLDHFSQNDCFAPYVRVLESGSESSTESVSDRDVGLVNSHLSPHWHDEFRGKSDEIEEKKDENQKVVSVKLGKYRSVDGGGEGSSVINSEARRCFSMGSFAYVMDESSSLKVPINKQYSCKKIQGHRSAMSECGFDSRRESNGFEAFKIPENQNGGSCCSTINDNKISKRESFSVSKFWLRGKRDKTNEATVDSSRRAFSFRLPMHRNPVGPIETKPKNGGVDDEEIERCRSLGSQENASSFGRRSLVWLIGRQNKVVDSSFSSNV